MATVVRSTQVGIRPPASLPVGFLTFLSKSRAAEAEADKSRRLSEALQEIIRESASGSPSDQSGVDEPGSPGFQPPDRVAAAATLTRMVPDLEPQELNQVNKFIDDIYEQRVTERAQAAAIQAANAALGTNIETPRAPIPEETTRALITQGAQGVRSQKSQRAQDRRSKLDRASRENIAEKNRRTREKIAEEDRQVRREAADRREANQPFNQKVNSKWEELKQRFPDIPRERAITVVQDMDSVNRRLVELYGGTVQGGLFEVLKNNKVPYSVAIRLAEDELARGGNAGEAATNAYLKANRIFQAGRVVPDEAWSGGEEDVRRYLREAYALDEGEAADIVEGWKNTGVFNTRVRNSQAAGIPADTPPPGGSIEPSEGRESLESPPPEEEQNLRSEEEARRDDLGVIGRVKEDFKRLVPDGTDEVFEEIMGLNKEVRDEILSAIGIDPTDVPYLLPSGNAPEPDGDVSDTIGAILKMNKASRDKVLRALGVDPDQIPFVLPEGS